MHNINIPKKKYFFAENTVNAGIFSLSRAFAGENTVFYTMMILVILM